MLSVPASFSRCLQCYFVQCDRRQQTFVVLFWLTRFPNCKITLDQALLCILQETYLLYCQVSLVSRIHFLHSFMVGVRIAV